MNNHKKMWPMGFFALFALMGLPMVLEGEWIGAVWFVWLLWLLYFIPRKDNTKEDKS